MSRTERIEALIPASPGAESAAPLHLGCEAICQITRNIIQAHRRIVSGLCCSCIDKAKRLCQHFISQRPSTTLLKLGLS
jgi:hypothetical protein